MAEEENLELILIDDHQLFREGVKRMLEMENEIEVVAEGKEGDEATNLVSQYQPDVVLLDINMPGGNGVEATRHLNLFI